ncbi:hypothetical protein BASA60_006470 [Batrachochytrium salamandrivorans]|nr:hypothetical protein BASA60_006470 [Batrachochytrium salamandrivorans]
MYYPSDCSAALTEIFTRFDKDGDGVFSQAEVDAFAIASNGSKFDSSTLEEIKEYFDVDSNGQLTLQGFLEMFQMQTLADTERTWERPEKHGYDDQLHLKT